ncbi:MAG: hypothetical protein V4677_17075 [Bacteroidota bacterium]
MKSRITYLFLILLVFSGFLKAQTDTLKKKPFMKLYAFSLNAGTLMNNETLTINALRKMSPDSKLLNQDYSYYNNKFNTTGGGFDGALQTAFIFYNRSKKAYNNKQEIRIGIHGQSSQTSDLALERKERVRFDTILSNTNPAVYYIDTVKTHTCFIENEQSNFLIDLSYVEYLRPQNKIFSAYIGGGLGYGMIVQNIIKARLRYTESFEDQNHTTYSYYTKSNDSGSNIHEETRLKYSNIYQGAINAGILMRFSNIRKNRVSNFAINVDGKVGLRLLDLPNIGLYKQFFFNFNFGVKIYLNREVYK